MTQSNLINDLTNKKGCQTDRRIKKDHFKTNKNDIDNMDINTIKK